jgi:AAA domain
MPGQVGEVIVETQSESEPPTSAANSTAAATRHESEILRELGVRTLKEIIDCEYQETAPLIDQFLGAGETALLIARQKEGKSTLAFQLGIDVALGHDFLGRFKTQQNSVLYVDYENRPRRIKDRGIDLAGAERPDNLFFVAYDLISSRDVGLFDSKFEKLKEIVEKVAPGLLIIDPLRFAVERDSSDEQVAIEALDRVSSLRDSDPQLAVILVHHLKKAQDNFTLELRTDQRAWIERVYGSQALLAHVETIWGLENDEKGYAFGTVSRSAESFVLGLEKQPDSQRFLMSPVPTQVAGMTSALRAAWNQLPQEFSRSEGIALEIPNNTLDRLIRYARPAGLLVQDPSTRRYRKATQAQNVGEAGER